LVCTTSNSLRNFATCSADIGPTAAGCDCSLDTGWFCITQII
jgi:hypothetical protein